MKKVQSEKLKLEELKVKNYKSQLELEKIINFFQSSLLTKVSVDDVLWELSRNLISQLGFVDCMIYTWNKEQTMMIQRAAYGIKDTQEKLDKQPFTVMPGQGVVGYVMQTKKSLIIPDTSKDPRYRPDEMVRLSELTVPILYDDELVGIIDSEHPQKNFFTQQQEQQLTTIAALVANKIKSIEADQSLQKSRMETYIVNEQLSRAKLETFRSQMNPHFIFNSLNAIQECILTHKIDAAYQYLSKFSRLQRMVLDNSEKELVPLSKELEMLGLYLSLESLRFSNSFTYEIRSGNISDQDEIMVPSLITQPFAENAIWHGLQHVNHHKILIITCEEINGEIKISIEDNGIGREQAAILKTKRLGSKQTDSKGMALVERRLEVLAAHLKVAIKVNVIDKKDESNISTGTTVVISFPSDLQL